MKYIAMSCRHAQNRSGQSITRNKQQLNKVCETDTQNDHVLLYYRPDVATNGDLASNGIALSRNDPSRVDDAQAATSMTDAATANADDGEDEEGVASQEEAETHDDEVEDAPSVLDGM